MPIVVSVLGAGRIGRDVIDHVNSTPGLRLGRVLTRRGDVDTADLAEFLAHPAEVIVEAAGPAALRAYGVACLSKANLWTVSAAALTDDAFRTELEAAAQVTHLRLFAPWVAGIAQVPASGIRTLTLRISRPGFGEPFSGTLREAAERCPDEVNFAVAAALMAPGLDATRIELAEARRHRIESVADTAAGRFHTAYEISREGRHPTALSIIAALNREIAPIRYG